MQKGSEELRASAGGNREEKKKGLKAKEQAELTEVARQPQGVPGGPGSGKFVLCEGVGSGAPSPAAPRVVQGAGLSTASRPASGAFLWISIQRHPVVTESQTFLSHRVSASGTHPKPPARCRATLVSQGVLVVFSQSGAARVLLARGAEAERGLR